VLSSKQKIIFPNIGVGESTDRYTSGCLETSFMKRYVEIDATIREINATNKDKMVTRI
jgi:hypothetical protein